MGLSTELVTAVRVALLGCCGTVPWLVRAMPVLLLLLAHSLFSMLVQPLVLVLETNYLFCA